MKDCNCEDIGREIREEESILELTFFSKVTKSYKMNQKY